MVLVEWEANGLFSIVSDKVTTEANINESVINLGVEEENQKEWINVIKKINVNAFSREESSKENINILINKGFDIKECSEKLRKLYIK